MKTIYILIGVPCSGKSYVAKAISSKIHHLAHDDYKISDYLPTILKEAKTSDGPLLIETPFSEKNFTTPLKNAGHNVIKLYLYEQPHILRERYIRREYKPYPQANITRNETFLKRAKEQGDVIGTSEEILQWLLKNII